MEKSGDNLTVSFNIRNTGRCDAMETAQVYVKDNECSIPRPEKELKGFEKVLIRKGEVVQVSISLDKEAFSYYDVDTHAFVVDPGEFTILVGPSSADLPLSAKVSM